MSEDETKQAQAFIDGARGIHPAATVRGLDLSAETPAPMSEADHARMAQAMAKRRRKLERYTNTPQAIARRAEQEREREGDLPWMPPTEPYPDPE